MPTLHWVGKDKVKHHHRDVPYRVLLDDHHYQAPAGTPGNSTDNRIIQGDNLEALKSLLPEFEGKVQCIYIDPPYNTGNEGWVYNDNVNDPRIKKWLGQVVGKEGEDMSRHDKWLCMMYPRLKLLHRLLADNGSIFVSIDDNEVHHLRGILDEIFGQANFVTTIIWQKVYSPKNSARHFSEDHDFILVYAKKAEHWTPNPMPRSTKQNERYKNPDNDPRGVWKPGDISARNHYSQGTYAIRCPGGRLISGPPTGMYWRYSQAKLSELDHENRIWWGPDGNGVPALKRFLSEVKQGVVPQTLWPYEEVGHTQDAKKELLSVINYSNSKDVFISPKPSSLIERILHLATDKDSVVLDSYAGSGTTAHAVLKLNAQDGGNRRFILIEMMDYADSLTAERVRRVMSGYGEGDKAVAGLGGAFTFQRLGEPLFDSQQQLNPAVGLPAIRSYIAWLECIPRQELAPLDNPRHRYWLGEANGQRVFFCYEPERITCLDMDLLNELIQTPGPTLFYADQLALGEELMRRHNLRFKKIPRDITRL
nr:site-specific DNA-methyltransferase [Pseudomonas sp. s4]